MDGFMGDCMNELLDGWTECRLYSVANSYSELYAITLLFYFLNSVFKNTFRL